MVNLNAQRNLPPDSTPWGKNIEKRLTDLEKNKRLEEANTRNTDRVLNNAINRLNYGGIKRVPGTGNTTATFTTPRMPSTSPEYNPVTLNTYYLEGIPPGTHLGIVSLDLDGGTFRLVDNSSTSIQHYPIKVTFSLSDNGVALWYGTKYTTLYAARTGSDWVTTTESVLMVNPITISPEASSLEFNLEEYRLFYGGNQLSSNTPISVMAMQLLLVN